MGYQEGVHPSATTFEVHNELVIRVERAHYNFFNFFYIYMHDVQNIIFFEENSSNHTQRSQTLGIWGIRRVYIIHMNNLNWFIRLEMAY